MTSLSSNSTVEAIRWTPYCLELLDQLVLPHQKVYRKLETVEETAAAIKNMVVRGAPAIGIAAAYGMTLATHKALREAPQNIEEAIDSAATLLMNTRPTAVNLAWAIERMKTAAQNALGRGCKGQELLGIMENTARDIHQDDIDRNLKLSQYGASLLPNSGKILTHCNAGALATGGHGTALGIIRTAIDQGKEIEVWVDETRPFLQGSRLTMYELIEDGVPSTLITDNMSGHLMSEGMVDAVIVGTDRTVANGDVANKIGTYTLAVLCARHGIPFYVACPLSTLDLQTATGKDIPIEHRAPSEVQKVSGTLLAPEGSAALHPAFDITPAELVSAIITEAGIAKAPFPENLARLMEAAPYD